MFAEVYRATWGDIGSVSYVCLCTGWEWTEEAESRAGGNEKKKKRYMKRGKGPKTETRNFFRKEREGEKERR